MEEQLQLIARRVVMRAIRHAHYPTVDGNPAPQVQEVLDKAVRYQVEAWEYAGVSAHIITGGATAEPRLKSTSENGASVTLDYGQADEATAWLLGGGLAPAAEAVLADAGLLGGMPGVWR